MLLHQPGILNPRTNPRGDAFQTLRLATEAYQGGGKVSGADILGASNDVLGNQPSLIIPPTAASQLKLKNEVASRTTGNADRRNSA